MIALCVAILVGVMLGLTGAGGSIVAVPLFVLLLDLSVNDAMGLALGTVAIAAMVGVAMRFSGYMKSVSKDCHISGALLVRSLLLALVGMSTAPLGRALAVQLNDTFLMLAFFALANGLAIRMWWQSCRQLKPTPLPNDSSPNHHNSTQTGFRPYEKPELGSLAKLAVLFTGIGLLSGLFGVGGGFLIVPVLQIYMGLSIRVAVGISLIIIALVSSSGFFFHVNNYGDIPLATLIQAGLGSAVGVVLGGLLMPRFSNQSLQKVFAATVLALTSFTLFQYLA